MSAASLVGMALLLLAGACLCRVTKAGLDAEAELLAGVQAESLAHTGAVVAIARLKNDREFQNQLESGMINHRNPFMTGSVGAFSAGRYEVYVAQREKGCAFVSIGTVKEARRQAVVEVRFAEDGFSQVWNDG